MSLMTNATARAIFNSDLASQADAPDWVELFPAGPKIRARDGREWTANPKAVLEAFRANQAPLPIDWEHAQAHLAPIGQEAPAAGWIKELEERAGAVWGRVEWVAKAAAQIKEKSYRFLSPDFQHRPDGEIISLNGAGLVNRPAMIMTALSRVQPTNQEKPNMLTAIAKALGLAEAADEATILSAIAQADEGRKVLCKALKIDEASDIVHIGAAVARVQNETATALAAKSNTALELTTLKHDLSEIRTALAASQAKEREREIDAALDEAATAGKITPASRAQYRAMCEVEGGVDKFRALAATLPVIGEPSRLDGKPTTANAQGEPDAQALAARARTYQAEQQAVGNTVSISAAVAHVKEQQP
ncbi:hypothetical protein BTE77_27935 [Ensifer adhaerens]|nr:hypothetical protein BTE77_27935 [Ensifer adhaerens]